MEKHVHITNLVIPKTRKKMAETLHIPENPTGIEYLESYKELKKHVKTHQGNHDIPIFICCDVREYQEEYGKELAAIQKARQRLENFIRELET